MGTLSVRNLQDDLKQRLRIRAATNGRSMEEEVRCILREALAPHSAATPPASAAEAETLTER